ncbi:DUF4260 family protein [Granulicella rosea]|uniref:DUF4260 family protein n=1 Tax=Granulicella rosea TaxID=474952 RepID=UPI000B7954B4
MHFHAYWASCPMLSRRPLCGQLSLVWVTHVSMDRLLGYGRKYPEPFKFMHIQSSATPITKLAV